MGGVRRGLGGAVLAAVVLLALVSVASLWGSVVWWLDLLAHFRWQYAFAAGLLGVAALCLRQRAALLLALLVLGQQSWLLWPTAPPAASPTNLRLDLLSANPWVGNARLDRLLDWAGPAPQVLVLTELSARQADQVAQHWPQLRPVIVLPAADAFGIGVWSQWPVLSAQRRELGPLLLASLHVQLRAPDGVPVDLFAVHPMPPISAAASAARDAQLRELIAWVQEQPRPRLILTGDFNASRWSHILRELDQALRLEDGTHRHWPWPTWQPRPGALWRVLLGAPIDQVLLRGGRLQHHILGPDVGSDHRPWRVEIGW